MDWRLLLSSVWLCLILAKSEDIEQRFYFTITKNDDDLTLEQCENCQCLRRGAHDLKCMCEETYRESERWRAECGDGGRNETAVELLRRKNVPEKLGLCAKAFANLGYLVAAVPTNSSEADKTTYSDRELDAKISELSEYSAEFWNLLDRTLVGVYLPSDQQRNICKDAYNEWLCSVSLSLYNASVNEIKPCISVCTRVVQQCPYYLPSKFQGASEIIYGGYPVFDCPDIEILDKYSKKFKSCSANASCQPLPYSLGKDCFGRDGNPPNPSHQILVFVLSIISAWALTS